MHCKFRLSSCYLHFQRRRVKYVESPWEISVENNVRLFRSVEWSVGMSSIVCQPLVLYLVISSLTFRLHIQWQTDGNLSGSVVQLAAHADRSILFH